MKQRHSGARSIDGCARAMCKCKNNNYELIVPIFNSTVVHGNIPPIYTISPFNDIVYKYIALTQWNMENSQKPQLNKKQQNPQERCKTKKTVGKVETRRCNLKCRKDNLAWEGVNLSKIQGIWKSLTCLNPCSRRPWPVSTRVSTISSGPLVAI